MKELDQLTVRNEKTRCINNIRPNVITRVSVLFEKRMNAINKEREDSGMRGLSNPMITEFITKHRLWPQIHEDIINYILEDDEE